MLVEASVTMTLRNSNHTHRPAESYPIAASPDAGVTDPLAAKGGEWQRTVGVTANNGEGATEVKVKRSGPIRQRRTAVFGGFASGSPWTNMGRGFSGDGNSFLFLFEGRGGARKAGEEGCLGDEDTCSAGGGAPHVYTWGGLDRCFMTSDEGIGLGMGGGGGDSGNFGFFVEPGLRTGSTGRCETFRNPPLTAGALESSDDFFGRFGRGEDLPAPAGGMFDVLSVEVWGFRPAKAPEGLRRVAL